MGHSYSEAGGFGDFTVVKTNPSGTTVRFTLSDAANRAVGPKIVQAVLKDAVEQWIVIERADLDTNGDSAVAGADLRYIGDGFAAATWNYAGKYVELTLTATTDISVTGNITVSIPYGDVA